MAEQSIADAELSEAQRARLEEFIEEEEGSFNRYRGWLATFLTAVAVASSFFHLYAAYGIVRTDLLREIHVGIVLFLIYMLFPTARRFLIAGGLLLVTPLVTLGIGGWTLPMHADHVGIGLILVGVLMNVGRVRALRGQTPDTAS